MVTSRHRILSTHVGSLPRNDALSFLLVKREEGEAVEALADWRPTPGFNRRKT